jgi:hypothetical protein
MYSHKWTAALAVAVVFALQPTASNAQSKIGKANSVKPEASGTVAGTLSAGSDVHASETVRTGSAGQADLRFIDSTNLSVGPASTVRLDKFVYDPKKGSGSVAIEASRGAFRFVTGSQNKGGDYKVKTPYGTLGVRG